MKQVVVPGLMNIVTNLNEISIYVAARGSSKRYCGSMSITGFPALLYPSDNGY